MIELSEKRSDAGTMLAMFGLMCMSVLVLIRAMVEHDGFPMWESDAFVFLPPVVGLTPIKAIVLNLGVVLSSCLALCGFIVRKDRLGVVAPVLLSAGVLVLAYHGFNNFETAVEGSNILAIFSVLYVASLAHKIGDAQKIIAAITLGFACMLAVVGAYEVFVIHPNTVADYETHRDSFLAARGWSADSAAALGYERRLYQAEPIAWFGLTNVFASFAGACSAGLLILGWLIRKENRASKLWMLAAVGGLISLAGLLMTGAKGGVGAFVLGLGLTGFGALVPKLKIDGRTIVAACGFVVLLVIGRGFIGERLSELSLLFRSQYMTGSMRMFLEHPLVGVGPGAFQEHYMMLKPDLSPEDVASAHSLGFDLLGVLGVGGLALFCVFGLVISRIRPTVLSTDDASGIASGIEPRVLIQVSMLVIAVASVVSIRFGAGGIDINLLLVQIIGSLIWAAMAYAIVRHVQHVQHGVLGQLLRWAMFAAAAVLSIHAMIEVSASWMVSGMLWALMIGTACTVDEKRTSRWMPVGVVGMLVLGVSVFGFKAPALMRWENELHLAAQSAADFSVMSQSEINLSKRDAAELEARRVAGEHLVLAAQARPTHTKTWIAASQQMLWMASYLEAHGQADEAQALWYQTLVMLGEGAEHSTGASGYRWLGTVWSGRTMTYPADPNRESWLEEAFLAWETAFERSPHDAHLAVKLMDLAIKMGDADAAKIWADQALALDEQHRLDPLGQLDDQALMRARVAALRGDTGSP